MSNAATTEENGMDFPTTMTETDALTDNERDVLMAALLCIYRETGGEFGFSDYVKDYVTLGQNQHSVAGTLGHLVRKGFVDVTDDVQARTIEPPQGRQKRPTWTPMSAILDLDAAHPDRPWELLASKSDKVRERCATAVGRYGPRCMSQDVTNHPGRPLSVPLPTVTGQDQIRLVRGDETRRLTIEETLAAQGMPTDYVDGVELTRGQAIEMAGNAVPPQLAEAIAGAVLEVAA